GVYLLIEIRLAAIVRRTLNAILTIYMMLILLRWLAPWLQLDTFDRRIRWAWRFTDPLIKFMRRILPPMGPVDFGPVAALFIVFIIRLVALRMF
ncbi:MAG: YggT family protein, partial [Armatimonadetes bacterium]|nr:YggT family protein [Armatimonadota bacterium]